MILLIWFSVCYGWHFKKDVITKDEIVNGATLTVKNGILKKSFRLRATI